LLANQPNTSHIHLATASLIIKTNADYSATEIIDYWNNIYARGIVQDQ
jgi:hypothetical protein